MLIKKKLVLFTVYTQAVNILHEQLNTVGINVIKLIILPRNIEKYS